MNRRPLVRIERHRRRRLLYAAGHRVHEGAWTTGVHRVIALAEEDVRQAVGRVERAAP